MGEKWRVIDGFEDYAVSDRGRVKRLTTRTCAKAGSILKQAETGEYRHVTLMKDGKKHNHNVHVLVTIAFHGPRPDGLVANHIDGKKKNNREGNLEWGTQSHNVKHAYDLGLSDARGERNSQAKLDAAKVIAIRQAADGVRGQCARLARQFGVSPRQVADILSGKAWPHLLAGSDIPA